MLPTYVNDNVHQRHAFPHVPGGEGLLQSKAVQGILHAVPRSKRPIFARALQSIMLVCVCLPAIWLLRSSVTRWRIEATTDHEFFPELHGKKQQLGVETVAQTNMGGGRKMMTEVVPKPGAHLKHLILVAGHAVYVGKDYSEATLESSWFLEEYQKVKGEAASFVEHIELGIREADQDPDAMLLFSGGQTRLAAGPRSEGLSYWVVAEAAGWFNTTSVRGRTFTEEHARDSFENLLFSLCRFYELSGHYPDKVTVVSYRLKRDRFYGLHRAAVHFPETRFKFVGTELPPDVVGAQEGEAGTVAAFRQDPYGCKEPLLDKKLRRDPFAVGPPHPSRCPALKGLLQYCGTTLYEGRLPWV